jgi:hypothetical protein
MDYRKIWESINGPIPKDEQGRSYEIHHIDGNRDNNSIDNLKCVSIEDHYKIHLEQNDFGACHAIEVRMGVAPSVGWTHSQDTKDKIRRTLTGRKQTPEHIENVRLGRLRNNSDKKTADTLRGRKQSKETRNKRSKSLMGTKRPKSQEQRDKIRKTLTGKKQSEESKVKKRLAQLQKPTLTCPHCGLVGKYAGMKRWHFDNCKNKK